MKTKIIGLLLALIMIIMYTQSAFGEEEPLFIPKLLNTFGRTASEWYETDMSRALFAVLMMMEGLEQCDEFDKQVIIESLDLNSVYVSKSVSVLGVFYFGLDKFIMCQYDSTSGTAGCVISEFENVSIQSESIMKSLVYSKSVSSYEKVDSELFLDLLDKLHNL